jgi:microcystin-dependent protein
MSNPYIGEIRLFGGNYAPVDWAFCNGALLPISEYPELYMLIGTTYGGDGVNTFALPNLMGRIPIHQGTGLDGNTYVLGESAGAESVTLTINQIPQHSHAPIGSSSGGQTTPIGNSYGSGEDLFSTAAPSVALLPGTVANVGGSQPHSNLMPSLCVSYIIAVYGVYPTF